MERPRVLVDGYFLGKPYGFGRFIFELCRALGQASHDLLITVAVPDRPELADLPSYPGLAWHRMADANFIVWEQMHIPRLARRLACDVIHFPYNTRALFLRGTRAVTTVHDLLFLEGGATLRNLKAYVAERYARLVFQLATPRSSALVSVSVSTQALLERLGLSSTVVYNTVSGFIAAAAAEPAARQQRYVLHRGGYMPHRNTERVLEAFARARPALPGVQLKILGAPQGAERWGVAGDRGVEFLPRLSDQALGQLYAGASCIVAASLVEGFGLPIIEGFGFGAPVITSNIDPMREIAGEAAVLVDPTDVGAMTQAMVQVLGDPHLAEQLVARGHKRLRSFSSELVAAKMLEVYRSCGRQAA